MADTEFVKSCADTPLMRDVLQERDTLRERVEALTQALRQIAAGGLCECDHSDENCCEKQGEFCEKCIAEVALREVARKLVEEK